MVSADRRVDFKAVSKRSVVNAAGERLGHIKHLFIDMDDGRIEFATLALANHSRAAGRGVNIPWSQFGLSPDGRHLQLDIGPDVLKAAAARQNRG